MAATTEVTLGFLPASEAIPDPDHVGLLRAGARGAAPYGDESVEFHRCRATDLGQDARVQPDLRRTGFDTVDLSGLAVLQEAFARVADAGRISDEDAATIRSSLGGATLPCSGGTALEVLYISDEGFVMRSSGPNRLPVVGPRTKGMNGHGVATSIHVDQDAYGTPLTQLMDGRAPSLFWHDSPDGQNHDAGLLLVNLWIPLQQVVQPLVLADGRSIDRRSHQLRYGLPTTSFLERDDEMAINDIWTVLHSPDQRWYYRSEMDHSSAYVFNTLSTPHGSGTLPGEDLAERCYRGLEEAEGAAARGDVDALSGAVGALTGLEAPDETPAALGRAISQMVAVAGVAADDAAGVCGERSAAWLSSSRAARRGVVRMSLELRMVVSVTS